MEQLRASNDQIHTGRPSGMNEKKWQQVCSCMSEPNRALSSLFVQLNSFLLHDVSVVFFS